MSPARHCRATWLLLLAVCHCAWGQDFAPGWVSQLLAIPAADSTWRMQVDTDDGQSNPVQIHNDIPSVPEQFIGDRQWAYDVASRKIRNLQALRRKVAEFEAALSLQAPTLRLAYRSELKEIVIALERSDKSLDDPLQRHWPILHALPNYTRINVLVPESLIARVQQSLARQGFADRTTLLPVESEFKVWRHWRESLVGNSTHWVRDAMLVGSTGQKTALFLPLSYNRPDDLAASDTNFLEPLAAASRSAISLPLFVRSGNLAVGMAQGVKYGFIGENEITLNQQTYLHSFGYSPPPQAMPEILKVVLGVDQMVLLPNTSHLYHIDFAMAVLAENLVALVDPLDRSTPDADQDALEAMRQKIAALGFQVAAIPTSTNRLRHFSSPVNAIPFVHAEDHVPSLILPLFADEQVSVQGRLMSLNQLVAAAYQHLGYRPLAAEERFHPLEGNTHCVLYDLE